MAQEIIWIEKERGDERKVSDMTQAKTTSSLRCGNRRIRPKEMFRGQLLM